MPYIYSIYNLLLLHIGDRDGTVVKVLRYGPGVDSASNRNEYQEHFLGVKAAGA